MHWTTAATAVAVTALVSCRPAAAGGTESTALRRLADEIRAEATRSSSSDADGRPLPLASHAHDSCYDAVHCALCGFASISVALSSRPPQLPTPVARVDLIRRPIDRLSSLQLQAANQSRAPPGCLS